MASELRVDKVNSASGSVEILGADLDLSGDTAGIVLPKGEQSTEGAPSERAMRLEITNTYDDEGALESTTGIPKVFTGTNEWKELVDTNSPYATSKVSIVKENLVLYLDTSESSSYPGTGLDWFDLSGEDNHAVFPSANLATWQGNYFDFNGSTHRAYVTNLVYGNNSKQIPEGTFAFMVRTTYDNGGGTSYNTGNWSIIDWDRSEVVSVNLGGGGAINFAGRSTSSGGIGSSTIYDIAGNGLYNDNQWHYIAVTFSVADQKIIMYADGEVDREFLADGNMTPLGSGVNRYGWIGDGSEAGSAGAGTNNVYFDGDLGVVQIYEKVLSPDEIVRNYNVFRSKFPN